MTTLVGLQTDLNSLLKNLIELDYDAIEAYDAAIQRVQSDELRTQLKAFRADHLRHTDTLSQVLRESGVEPPKCPDIKRVLTQGKVVLASVMGDRAILFAMRTNETDTNVAYQRSVSHGAVPPQVRELLQGHLADERRHRSWMDSALVGELPPMPPPSGPAV